MPTQTTLTIIKPDYLKSVKKLADVVAKLFPPSAPPPAASVRGPVVML